MRRMDNRASLDFYGSEEAGMYITKDRIGKPSAEARPS
jgi:hypothetical protein